MTNRRLAADGRVSVSVRCCQVTRYVYKIQWLPSVAYRVSSWCVRSLQVQPMPWYIVCSTQCVHTLYTICAQCVQCMQYSIHMLNMAGNSLNAAGCLRKQKTHLGRVCRGSTVNEDRNNTNQNDETKGE